MKKKNNFLSGIALISLLCLCAGFTEGALIIVPDDYSTIQEAVFVSSQHDVIYVRAGVYTESVSVIKPLRLIAEDGNQKVKSVKVYPQQDFGFNIRSDYVTIDGFEIAYANEGIIAYEGSFCRLSNNYIHDCQMGINLSEWEGSADNNFIFLNVIEKIEKSAISVSGRRPDSVVSGSIIVKNEVLDSETGIDLTNAKGCLIENNIVEHVELWGIHLDCYESSFTTENNTISLNTIKDVFGDWTAGIVVSCEQGCVNEKNNIHQNYVEDVCPSSGYQDGIGIQMLGSYNMVHHNIVVNVAGPYNDLGIGNKVFKNSWQ